MAEPAPSAPKKGKLRENVEAILIAIVLALFIRTFMVQAFKIPSGSMENTLLVGDHILVNKFIYGVKLPFVKKTIVPVREIRRDDIIVFEFPQNPRMDYIKRVIGLPGDVVEIRNKTVFVNSVKVENVHSVFKDTRIHPGLHQGVDPGRDNMAPQQVPAGKLFVMGDNRDFSYDSRFWGVVDQTAVKGKAFMVYWSWNSQTTGVRWNRLGHMLE
ncbi:signal peptidase I [Desulfosarcina sp. OttesenSCG-928-G10]|nr:signal peptidase I [Desulfosarcina sp. OttesenSCG-928-G10]MDL2321329.1 signal peptidase I [Desulfosarcina sp. OttesenSCG-928-B08]